MIYCMKIIMIVFGIILFGLFSVLIQWFNNSDFWNMDFCLDTAICAEGLTINVEGKMITISRTISRQSCAELGGVWSEERKECDLRD